MRATFIRPVTIDDVGMGALYFFASHMVIRSMFYVGVGRSAEEVAVFFLVVLGAIVLVHLFAGVALRARLAVSAYLKVPVVSAIATVGAALVLLSILPITGLLALYTGGLCIGLACGWLVVIWMSSFHVKAPDPLTFVLSPTLLCAVGCYFCFRIASSISAGVAEGLLLALPLVSMACLVVGEPRGSASDAQLALREEAADRRRASLVLICVSASFALLSAIIVHLAGKGDLPLGGGLNYMVLFELIMVLVVLACCYLLHWFASQQGRPRRSGPFVTAVLSIPAFLIGLATGATYQPESVASLMWETSFWVMLVAVFAYDLRQTLYVGRGLAVGLMFESMCVGQMAMQLVAHVGDAAWVGAVAVALAALYLVGVWRQLLGHPRCGGDEGSAAQAGETWGDERRAGRAGAGRGETGGCREGAAGGAGEMRRGSAQGGVAGGMDEVREGRGREDHAAGEAWDAGSRWWDTAGRIVRGGAAGQAGRGGLVGGGEEGGTATRLSARAGDDGVLLPMAGDVAAAMAATQDSPEAADGARDPVLERCRALGEEFYLTQGEIRILAQLARGRSARYIADDLGISFNTVRTHIRHVYEKTGIHSKQELIDLVADEG